MERCPICKKKKADLAAHLVKVHKMGKEFAENYYQNILDVMTGEERETLCILKAMCGKCDTLEKLRRLDNIMLAASNLRRKVMNRTMFPIIVGDLVSFKLDGKVKKGIVVDEYVSRIHGPQFGVDIPSDQIYDCYPEELAIVKQTKKR